ncbi:hypothetical protein L1887_15291 [Cichorium endivia]|nr:hypothetical protein L1887_15291 [Cichorium endivia]
MNSPSFLRVGCYSRICPISSNIPLEDFPIHVDANLGPSHSLIQPLQGSSYVHLGSNCYTYPLCLFGVNESEPVCSYSWFFPSPSSPSPLYLHCNFSGQTLAADYMRHHCISFCSPSTDLLLFVYTSSVSWSTSGNHSETHIPTSPETSEPRTDTADVNTKLDTVLSMVKELNSSHSNEAILTELAEIRKKVDILEKKDLTVDSSVQKEISEGLQSIDAQRHSNAKELVKQSESKMNAALKLYKELALYNSDMSEKFLTLFDDLDEMAMHLPVTPSTAEGAPGGGMVPPKE